MARKMCDVCGNRAVGTGKVSGYEDPQYSREQGMCNPCGDEGQMSIAHLNGHESISEDECWYCHPELDETQKEIKVRTGHTNTVARSHNSHAGHTHPVSPKARAICRKSIAAGNGPWDGTH